MLIVLICFLVLKLRLLRRQSDVMKNIVIRTATLQDAEKSARLHVLEKDLSWRELLPVFKNEFAICVQNPNLRIYYLAFIGDDLIGYAGAHFYNNAVVENMYDTQDLQPTGWYLRGIKVHPD